MTPILIDTNVVLDIALKREPFFTTAKAVFEKIEDREIQGYITASAVTDIFYISSKQKGKEEAKDFLINLLLIVEVIGVSRETIVTALHSDLKDFEDAVQVAAANENDVKIILTRNVKDFKESGLKILTPPNLIDFLDNHKK